MILWPPLGASLVAPGPVHGKKLVERAWGVNHVTWEEQRFSSVAV